MKRLLLPLLAALALPTAVNAGDLGAADFETPEANRYEITEKNDRSQNFGQMRCGFRNKIGKCTVQFIDGRLKVDDSKGITSDQVLFFDTFNANDHVFSLQIVYRDSQGIINAATFHTFDQAKRWHRFMKEFLYFLNHGNESIPSDFF